jgi:hypothetical protein
VQSADFVRPIIEFSRIAVQDAICSATSFFISMAFAVVCHQNLDQLSRGETECMTVCCLHCLWLRVSRWRVGLQARALWRDVLLTAT